jgi:hypothetical protein
MGFEASRAGLRFGYTSIKQWLSTDNAAAVRQRFETPPPAGGGAAARYFSLLTKDKAQR